VLRASGATAVGASPLPQTNAMLDVPPAIFTRRLPVGSEVTASGVHFRVWAPERTKVEVIVDGSPSTPIELIAEPGGYFSAVAANVRAGDRYRFRLDGDDGFLFPDPASRFQPEGPHGPSEVVDPVPFPWTDASWPGVGRLGQVIYEMHIGTFTREGTWASAMHELAELSRLGVTVLEATVVRARTLGRHPR